MSRTTRFISASVVGAGLMYLFDPERGRRRRALVRDKLTSAVNEMREGADVTSRDVSHRSRGLVATLRSLVFQGPVSDRQLAERVRAALGRLVGHPGAIDVRVQDGRVSLSGPALADEVDGLLAGVAAIRGVRDIDNRLEVHREPGNIPGLQGAPRRPSPLSVVPFMQTYWSPTARLAAGAGGLGLAVSGLRRGGVTGGALGLAGLTVLLRGLTNMELSQLTGLRSGRRPIRIQKTITVNAPVDRVYQVWSRYENFPRFMENVREIRQTDGGRSRWVVAGPGGVPVEWETEITAHVPNQLIAWRTVPGSVVEHTGIVRFEPIPGGTRVEVRMSYTPPAGAIGHSVAAVLGQDPKRAMDEDLIRFKSLLEQGKTIAEGRTVDQRELAG